MSDTNVTPRKAKRAKRKPKSGESGETEAKETEVNAPKANMESEPSGSGAGEDSKPQRIPTKNKNTATSQGTSAKQYEIEVTISGHYAKTTRLEILDAKKDKVATWDGAQKITAKRVKDTVNVKIPVPKAGDYLVKYFIIGEGKVREFEVKAR